LEKVFKGSGFEFHSLNYITKKPLTIYRNEENIENSALDLGPTSGSNRELGILCKQTDGQFGFLGRPQGKVLRAVVL
jgi:hypothetical protein